MHAWSAATVKSATDADCGPLAKRAGRGERRPGRLQAGHCRGQISAVVTRVGGW